MKATLLTRFFDDPSHADALPRPFGVFYQSQRPTYEQMLNDQVNQSIERYGEGSLDELLAGRETWVVR